MQHQHGNGWTLMRHASCGALALYVSDEIVLGKNPKQKILAKHIKPLYGPPIVAGKPLLCPQCAEVLVLGPPHLMPDRGPDRRESKLQDFALTLAERILFRPRCGLR